MASTVVCHDLLTAPCRALYVLTQPCEALYVLRWHRSLDIVMRDADLAAHIAIHQPTGSYPLTKLARTGSKAPARLA